MCCNVRELNNYNLYKLYVFGCDGRRTVRNMHSSVWIEVTQMHAVAENSMANV
jgi:hypothetical protein